MDSLRVKIEVLYLIRKQKGLWSEWIVSHETVKKSCNAEMQVLPGLCLFLEALGMNPYPSPCRLEAKFSTLHIELSFRKVRLLYCCPFTGLDLFS